jgi:hypothetical protein
VTVLEFLSARTERQREAFDNIKTAVEAYDVECIDTLIGDIVPPAELMKTQTDRKIAAELERTYEAQREAQVKRQALERETAWPTCRRGRPLGADRAHLAADGARAAEWRAASRTRRACAPKARRRRSAERRGRGAAVRAVRLAAKADAYKQGMEAVGGAGYTANQLATTPG